MDTILSFLGTILAYAFVIIMGIGIIIYVIQGIIFAMKDDTIKYEKPNFDCNDENDDFTSNYFQNINITIK